MAYTSYANINTLEDMEFIAGSTEYIDFTIQNDAGVPIGVTGKTLEWRLAPYGQKNFNSVTKTEASGVTTPDLYTKRVTLDPTDTQSLSGKYVQQVIVVETNPDLTTTTYKPAQGVVTIISAIKNP